MSPKVAQREPRAASPVYDFRSRDNLNQNALLPQRVTPRKNLRHHDISPS